MATICHLLPRYFTARALTVSITSLFILHEQRKFLLTSGHSRNQRIQAVDETQTHDPLC